MAELLLLLLVVKVVVSLVGRSCRTQSWVTWLENAVQIDQAQYSGAGVAAGAATARRHRRLLAEDAAQKGSRRLGRGRWRLLLLLLLLDMLARRSGRAGLRAVAATVIPGCLQDEPSRSGTPVASAIDRRVHYNRQKGEK